MTEPLRRTPRIRPDLIASSQHDQAEVLFRMSRLHAGLLGAYLNGRNDIAPLPDPIAEILDALTTRLVQPPGARWQDLRRALDGQPPIMPPLERAPYAVRRRRAYDGGENGEDLNQALLGDADGTTLDEWPTKEDTL